MSSFFSGYVGSLTSTGAPPEPGDFEDALDKLRKALIYELKKRGLWNAPPSYLGVFGGTHWIEEDLLDELLLDCYEFIFIRRLNGLQNQLAARKNIDGLVFLNIRHFLYETQKRHDPLGFRTFEMLQEATSRLLEQGIVHLLGGDPKVRNDTILGFSPALEPHLAHDCDLSPQVILWNNELLPELITAWNREPILAKLQDMLAGLPATGTEVFCFRDLIEPMKDDVRGRWHAVQLDLASETAIEKSGGELVSIVQWIRPARDYELRQNYRKLNGCVAEGIDSLRARETTREYLHRLWLFLYGWAAETESESQEANTPRVDQNQGGRLPTDTSLGDLLRIPRGRIPSLKLTLGELVRGCQRDNLGKTAVIKTNEEVPDGIPVLPQPSRASQEGRPAMDLKRRSEELRLQTGRVAARVVEQGRPNDRKLSQSGNRFVFAESETGLGEWVVLDSDPDGSRQVLVAPIDQHPLVGSSDVTASDGVTVVRCGLTTWLGVRSLASAQQVGILEEDVLSRARLKVRAIADGSLRPKRPEREVDAAPEYLRWIEQQARARDDLRERLPKGVEILRKRSLGPTESIPTESRDYQRVVWRDYRLAYALAATFFAATLGLSFWVGKLDNDRNRPILLPASSGPEVVFRDRDRTIESLALRTTASYAVIYLILAGEDEDLIYRVELLEQGDSEVLWASEDLVDDTQFFLALPRRILTAENYRLLLYGRDQTGEEQLLEERTVRILLE